MFTAAGTSLVMLLPLLLLLLLLPPGRFAAEWNECAFTICVECHSAAFHSPITVYRWFSTGWFDCQSGSALSYTDFCKQQPLPFNQTPPFPSIFSSEKEMSFGSDGGDPDIPFLVRIPFKNTSPMVTAALNVSSAPSLTQLLYHVPTLVHDIIPLKITLPMCVQPLPSASQVLFGKIGVSSPEGSNGVWLYIVDKRGATFSGSISNVPAPRRSPASQMITIGSEHAFTARSGCKYVYAVLYVASAPGTVAVSFDWLPQASEGHGAILTYDYLSAEKFEFDPSRNEGAYRSVLPYCDPQLCDGNGALFDIIVDGLGGATLHLVTAPAGDVLAPDGIIMLPISGKGYRLGNVLRFETSLFGGGASDIMVTITGIAPVRKQLPLRLLSHYDAVLVSGVETTDVWAELLLSDFSNTATAVLDAAVLPSEHIFSVSPRVASPSLCTSRLSPLALTNLAKLSVGPGLSNVLSGSCRRVCGATHAAAGPALVTSSGPDRCGTPVFSPGDTASVVCAEGHWLSSGAKDSLCNIGYIFSSNAVCSPLSCSVLAAPHHGYLLPSPQWQGKFACDQHWKLDGKAVLTCMSSGQWDHPAPTCVRITCSPAAPPPYSVLRVKPMQNLSFGNMTEYTVVHSQSTLAVESGTVLMISCQLGFHLAGHHSTVCEYSGAYNASLGTCLPIPCLSFSTLNLPPRALAIPASIRYLDTAVVTCESGYRFENGSAEIGAWCDVYGNVSVSAHVPLCIRIPNFCEANPLWCFVIISWPFFLTAAALLWFYVLQTVLITVVLPSTGDQISLRCTRYKPLRMLPDLIRKKWSLLPDEFVLRIVLCNPSDDVVSICRQHSSDAADLTDPMMQQKLYRLKLPQLSRFTDFSPRLVLSICPRNDADRVFVKKIANLSGGSAVEDSLVSERLHQFSVQSSQRWQHVHSASFKSIVPCAEQSLPPARAAKVFSWMNSNKAAWELHDDSSTAWRSTFRADTVSLDRSDAAALNSDAVDEVDLNRWVSKTVFVSQALRPQVCYEISVVTGSEFGAGTDSRVYCTLYGEGLQSPELELAASLQNGNPFETGQTDTFRHTLPQIGTVTSIRIRYDAAGFGSDWLLEKIRVKDATTGEVTEFQHGGWLSENATFVHLQARNCCQLFPYEIEVLTGSDFGAGTDSKVYCTLFGNICLGSSGEFELAASLEHSDPFETGAIDTFQQVLPRSLGCISSISIRLDASGLGSDWKLDRIRVKDLTSGEIAQFEHGGWLTKDNRTVTLAGIGQSIQGTKFFMYEISVDTATDPGSGTDSKVYCVLYGENGHNSGELALTKSMQHSDAFEAGKTDTFRHTLRHSLGRVHFVRVRHDATGVGSDWKLERVRVRDLTTGVTIEFDHGDWLTKEKTEILLPFCKSEALFPYEITVITGKDTGAGTDSKVFCTLHGTSWCGGELALATSLSNSDPFEAGNTDNFKHFFPRPLGSIASILIRCDASGLGADWLLDRVSVKDLTSGEIVEFQHGGWLTRDNPQVLLEALPALPVADCSDMVVSSEVRLPPVLSLPGQVADSFEESCAPEERERNLGESTPASNFAGEENNAVLEDPSLRAQRFKRAANMLRRLGVSKVSADSGLADPK